MSPSTLEAGAPTNPTTNPVALLFMLAIWKWLSFPFLYGRDLLRTAVLCVRVLTAASLLYLDQTWEDFKDSPYYYMAKVVVLKRYAWFTKQSYLVRFRDSPPQFIAAPSSTDVRSYSLNSMEKRAIYQQTGIDLIHLSPRRWRITEYVRLQFFRHTPFYQEPPKITIDLTEATLCGPKFIQGQGLLRHNFHVVLLEELGRWHGDSRLLASRGYSWTHNRQVFIKMPLEFAAAPTVIEEVRRPGGLITTRSWTKEEDFATVLPP